MDALWASSQQALADRYPGSTRRTAPGGGHYIHRTERDWFVAQVRSFLQDHR
jgi:pimeloyl-ACP methyl ester carboxylesterase